MLPHSLRLFDTQGVKKHRTEFYIKTLSTRLGHSVWTDYLLSSKDTIFVEMPSINITLESRVSLAFIVSEHINSMLTDIRKKIREEVDELIPQEFRFISIWGPPISEVQEAKMSIRDALHD